MNAEVKYLSPDADMSVLRQRAGVVFQAPPPVESEQFSNGNGFSSTDIAREYRESPYTLGNVCWILAAFAVLYYTNFAAVIAYDDRVHRTWLVAAVLFIGLFLSIAAFIIGYKKASSDDWETLYPAAIPSATLFIVCGGFCLNVALWPVWSFLTPVILFTLLMGVIIIVAMFP